MVKAPSIEGAFTNISIMVLIVRRLTEMRNVHYDENDE
jgi:hypothetical protein